MHLALYQQLTSLACEVVIIACHEKIGSRQKLARGSNFSRQKWPGRTTLECNKRSVRTKNGPTAAYKTNAPINVMPHYPLYGL